MENCKLLVSSGDVVSVETDVENRIVVSLRDKSPIVLSYPSARAVSVTMKKVASQLKTGKKFIGFMAERKEDQSSIGEEG